MKPVDIMFSVYIDFGIENSKNDPKFQVDDCVRISKYKYILQKAMFQINHKKCMPFEKLKVLGHGHIFRSIETRVATGPAAPLPQIIAQNYKTSLNSSRFMSIYNNIINLDTRDGILSVVK